jgi:hypothetical protein
LCEGALIATSLDPFDHYAKYPLVSHSVTPNTAALLSLRATGRQLGNIGNIFAMSYATLCHSDQKQPLVALVKP